jgi:biotin carboxyl carrier protein
MNTSALEKVTIGHGDQETDLYLKYISKNKFSVYQLDRLKGTSTPILEDCEVQKNPEDPSEVIVRTPHQQFKVPYLTRNDGELVFLDDEGQPSAFTVVPEKSVGQHGDSVVQQSDVVKSPMPGTVVKIYVKAGQEVKANDPLISVESMKMEFLIRATHDAKVDQIRASEGKFVQIGEQMITFVK